MFNPRANRSPPSWINATSTTSITITVSMIWLSKRWYPYRYGYQRFDSQIMLTVIVMLVVLVALIQLGGDRLARGLNKR
ncbi:hypothetical protein QV12_00005, partial [Pseudomonas putida]